VQVNEDTDSVWVEVSGSMGVLGVRAAGARAPSGLPLRGRGVLPLIRPVIATIAVFVMVPACNDLWLPLILAPAENVPTRHTRHTAIYRLVRPQPAGCASRVDPSSCAAAGLLRSVSRQLLRGLTAGAIK